MKLKFKYKTKTHYIDREEPTTQDRLIAATYVAFRRVKTYVVGKFYARIYDACDQVDAWATRPNSQRADLREDKDPTNGAGRSS